MGIAIIYKKILNLELWHDYYLGQPGDLQSLPVDYDVSNLLEIVPTPDCLRLLKSLRWVFRTQPYGASIFASVEKNGAGDFQTQVPIDLPERLTFWLVVRDPYFANFTNLPLRTTPNKIYYFSNLADNQVSSFLYLTQPLSVYTLNAEYFLGQLVSLGNKTLESLKYKAAADSIPDDNDWSVLPNNQYVSELDYQPRQALSRSYTIPNANPNDTFRLKLVDMNGAEPFATEVIASNKHPPGEGLLASLNFTGLIPGRYQLTLNDREVDDKFVLVDPIVNRDTFGLVEIALNSRLVTPAFALLQNDSGQTLISPRNYVIRFKNRMTRWRYKYEQPHRFKQSDLPSFTDIDEKNYVTKQPLGLLQQATPQITRGDPLLPSPSVTLIKPETDTNQHITNIFSDIHL